jgi:hypothetical protein
VLHSARLLRMEAGASDDLRPPGRGILLIYDLTLGSALGGVDDKDEKHRSMLRVSQVSTGAEIFALGSSRALTRSTAVCANTGAKTSNSAHLHATVAPPAAVTRLQRTPAEHLWSSPRPRRFAPFSDVHIGAADAAAD